MGEENSHSEPTSRVEKKKVRQGDLIPLAQASCPKGIPSGGG